MQNIKHALLAIVLVICFFQFQSQLSICQPGKVKYTVSLKEEAADTTKAEEIGNMAKIPAGVFWMGNNTGEGYGNERPYHPVYLDSFYIDIYEVMNMDYVEFLNAGGNDEHYHPIMIDDKFCGIFRYPNGKYAVTPGREDYPVTYVTWEDAAAYAKWCGKRLPTEAEWEKAARGGLRGKKTAYGDVTRQDEANYSGRHLVSQWIMDRWEYASPGGSLRPNGYGLYDMCGNLWEWVQDAYSVTFYRADTMYNPVNDPAAGVHDWHNRVIRGGSWADENGKDTYLRVACRGPNYPIPENWNNRIGFRCASSVPPSQGRQQQAGLEYVAQKMKENNAELYGSLSLDSVKSLIRLKRIQNPASAYQSKIKSIRKGMIMSIILPGTGEFYTGRWLPGLFFLVFEGTAWSFFASNISKANAIDVNYQSYAESHYSQSKYYNWLTNYQATHQNNYPPSYANLKFPSTKNSDYYSMIARFDQFLAGWDDFDPYDGAYGSSSNRKEFVSIRQSRRKIYQDYRNQAKYAGMFIIGNHVLSLVDTIWGIKRHSIYRSRGVSWDMDAQYYNFVPVPTLNIRLKW